MLNKKILCIHCNAHIGNLHSEFSFNYNTPTIIVPTKKGLLKKIRYKGTRTIDRYDSSTGFRVQFQINCIECGKNTTEVDSKDY